MDDKELLLYSAFYLLKSMIIWGFGLFFGFLILYCLFWALLIVICYTYNIYYNFKQKLMKHSKENLKIGTRYHIGDNLVGTYIGKGVDGDINFSVNVGVQVRHFSIRPNNQKEYYKVCLFGQSFRLFLLILSLLPVFGYFYIDLSQYGEISEILGFIWLVCYMAVLGIVFWNSNLIKKITR